MKERGIYMSNQSFSTNACYAVLSTCSEEGVLHAFLKLVIALVVEKGYVKLDPQSMVRDFETKYGFSLPYHPMQTVIQLGIDEEYFVYNTALKAVYTTKKAAENGAFMEMLAQQEAAYNRLLKSFGNYLCEKHNLFCSRQELSDKIHAFIYRYGLVSGANSKKVLEKVKNDYMFAEYLIFCEKEGKLSDLDFIENYITGCAFAEVMTFSVPTGTYKNCRARVFLDTGFIFSLLGIGSKDRSEEFGKLLKQMVHLGMKPMIFEHTYSEIAGIIDTARTWINNTNYDPAKASETAYYFVKNNWDFQKATELLGDLRRRLTEDYRISINNVPYPHVADIRTPTEEMIKQAIIDEYTRTNEGFCLNDKEYTINQDARSLFMVMHFDGGFVARTMPDLKNIFITTNRTLASVGKHMSAQVQGSYGTGFPVALTDLAWGTLVWANSPTEISSFNRASIISAAYAAFEPDNEILRRLNKTLLECQRDGRISPERCYFLKTNSVALRILAQRTMNEETLYTDQMPFEILQELREEGVQEGLLKKQGEINQLLAEKEAVDHALQMERHKNNDDRSLHEKQTIEIKINALQEKIDLLNQQMHFMEGVQEACHKKIQSKLLIAKILMSILGIAYVWAILYFLKNSSLNWIVDAITAIAPIILACVVLWRNGLPINPVQLLQVLKCHFEKCTYNDNKFDPVAYEDVKQKNEETGQQIDVLKKELFDISKEL